MHLWIRLLTWLRLPLAAAVALVWAFGYFEIGAWLFATGLLTRMLDTPLGVVCRCPIPTNDWLYRMVAVLFNTATIAGLTVGFCNNPTKIPTILATFPILPLIITGSIMATRLFVKSQSLLVKAQSGLISAVIILFISPFLSLWISFTCIGIIWAGEGFKILYYGDNPSKGVVK